jgi:hypothetical protein
MKFNTNQMYITINKVNNLKELNNFDFTILDFILKNKKYNIKFIDFTTCIQISKLFNYQTKNKIKWLFVAEKKYNNTNDNNYLHLLYYNIGKYYYIHNMFNFNLENFNLAIKYFNSSKSHISNSYYYLGCIYLILEVSKNISDRNYRESYKNYKEALKLGVKEAIEQERFVKELLIDSSFKNGNVKVIGETMKWINEI